MAPDYYLQLRGDSDEEDTFESPYPGPYIPQTTAELFKRFDRADAHFVGPPPVSHTWAARPKQNMLALKSSKPYDEEDADIELLYAQARKHEELGKKLAAARNRLNNIGSNIEKAAGPINGLDIYRETRELHATNQNVTRVLERLSVVQKPLEGKAEEERIIQEGPERVGLRNYLACIRRNATKCEELSNSSARINQEAAEQLNRLVLTGLNRLMNVWETSLEADKIEPLQYISRNQRFPTLEEGKTAELAEIYQFMMKSASLGGPSGKTAVTKYAEIRGRYLQGTLSNLATATLSTAKRFSKTTETYKPGDCEIDSYAEGMNLAFASEWYNISKIFNSKDRRTILETTASMALHELEETINQLNNQIKDNISTECFLAYDILGILNNLAFEIDKHIGCLKQEIFGAVKPIRDTAKQSLSDLFEDIRRRISSMVFFPMDASALPFTDEVLTRLRAMTTYPAPLGSIMSSVGDGNWTSASSNTSSASLPTLKSLDTRSDSSSLLVHYLADSIDTLLTNLELRSKTLHKSNKLTGIFMLNNLSIIDGAIHTPELTTLFPASAISKLQDDKRKRYLSLYLDPWRETSSILLDVQYTNRGNSSHRPPSGSAVQTNSAAIIKSLTSKDKDAIKEKFKAFNIAFADLCAKHRDLLGAMERDVRSELMRDIRALIEPLYIRFWDRYHELDKGKGKYVRYDKPAMSAQLATLA